MGSGGWFGLGLGSSRQKWGWLPERDSDFIFAILGEELGLIGHAVVLALFGAARLCRAAGRPRARTLRPARRPRAPRLDRRPGVVNIGAVLGLLPITGIPLPLVSYGGSALLPTMVALGMLLSFAKREPGAREALAAHGPGPRRPGLSWLGLGGTAPTAGADDESE